MNPYDSAYRLQAGKLFKTPALLLGYSNTGIDNRHQMTADLVWNMPKLKNALLERAIGGWTVGGKIFAYSGRPFSVSNGQVAAQIKITFHKALKALKITAIVQNNSGALPYLMPSPWTGDKAR